MGLYQILPLIVLLALFAVLIFKIPEVGLVLCLVIGSLFKGMLQPLLGPIDITVYLFAVTYGSIFIRCSMEKKLAVPDLRINIGVLLLVALLLASLLYTPLPRQGTDIFLRFVFLTISIMYATFMWCTNINRIKRLLFIFMGISLAYGVAAFVWTFLLQEGVYLGSRAAFPQTPPLAVATYLAVGILTAFILRGLVNSKYKRLALNLLMIIGVVQLIALNSRGPLIAFIVGGVCLFLLYSPGEKRRIGLTSLAPLAAIICAFILLPSQYTSRYPLITSLESSSIAWRLGAWQYVVEHFSDWFFAGAGICGFAYHYAGTIGPLAVATYPHNIFLDVFASSGFFGLLVFVWLGGSLLYKGVKMSRVGKRSIHLLALAVTVALIVFVTENFFSGTLTDTRWLWFFGGLILSLEWLWRKRDKESIACMLKVKE